MYWPCTVPQVYAHHGASAAADRSNTDIEGVEDSSCESGTNGTSNHHSKAIIDIQAAKNDHLFVTVTSSRLDVWSMRPVVVLASLTRSAKSLETYGENFAVALKPDASTIVIRTTESYLITYSVESDQNARVLQQQY